MAGLLCWGAFRTSSTQSSKGSIVRIPSASARMEFSSFQGWPRGFSTWYIGYGLLSASAMSDNAAATSLTGVQNAFPLVSGSAPNVCDDLMRNPKCSMGFQYPLVFEPAICPRRTAIVRKRSGLLWRVSSSILSQHHFASPYPLGRTESMPTRSSGTLVTFSVLPSL